MKSIKNLILKFRGIKLRQRMFLIYIIGGVIPLLVVSAFLDRSTKNILINNTQKAEIAELTLIKDNILGSMRDVSDVSKRMYFDEQLEHIAFKQYTNYEDLVQDYRDYTTMEDYRDYYYQEIQGISMYLENDTISENARFIKVDDEIRGQKWYQDTLEESGRVVWSFKYDMVKMKNYLCLSRVIRAINGRMVGVLAINMQTERTELPVKSRAKETLIVINGDTIISSNREDTATEEVIGLLKDYQEDKAFDSITYEGKKSILTTVRFNTPNSKSYINLVSIQPYSDILAEANEQSKNNKLYIITSILVSVFLISLFSSYFSRRVNTFKVQMHKAANGDFNIAKNIGGHDEISDLYGDLNTMIESIQHLVTTVFEEQVQKEKLNSRQKDVEFKMLASQINPHFLYNTLETIRMKARVNGETEIEELVKMLAKIMRRNIQVGDNLVTLKSELELVEYYLKIQQYRFGERVKFQIDLKCDIDNLKIMPLIIQPIVENAFVHGLETKEGEGDIHIIVERTDRLRIHVIDNGIGMSEEKQVEIKESLNDFSRLDRSHIGLSNVNQRIKLLYGEEYGICIESKENFGTTVIIELPEDMGQ